MDETPVILCFKRGLWTKSNLEEGLIAVGEQVLGLLRVNANDSEQEMASSTKGDLHLERGKLIDLGSLGLRCLGSLRST